MKKMSYKDCQIGLTQINKLTVKEYAPGRPICAL